MIIEIINKRGRVNRFYARNYAEAIAEFNREKWNNISMTVLTIKYIPKARYNKSTGKFEKVIINK